jgi:branched-chain amino acid transport system substrate-binding protein
VVVLSALSIVGSACGARVGPYLGGGSNLAGGSGGTTTTVASNNPGTQSSGGGGTGGGGGGAQAQGGGGASNPVVAPPAQFDYTPATEAGACKGTAGNTANPAQGISTNAIQIGNVSGLSGPLSGSFPQGPQAITALFDAVNAAGGVCGRQLQLNVQDDGQNSTTNASDVQNLINKPVFAFAGSTSDADNGGVPAMQQAGVPDFGFAINCVRSESATYWSVAGGSCYQPQPGGPYYIGDGYFLNAQQHGYLPKKMAFLAYSIAISAQAAQQFEYVYQHTFGGTPCYTDFSISPFNVNLEPDVATMQSKGCDGVIDTLDVTGNAQLLKALQQQNYSMPFVAATFDAYTPVLISTAGQSAAQNFLVTVPFIPLNESQHMDVMYKQQLQQYVPGAQPSGFGFLAWLAGQMMIYSLLQAGRNPTRASVVQVLNGLQNYDVGGAVGPHAPSNHGSNICTVDVTVQGNDFVRKSPPSGLFCGGQEVQAS